MKLTDYAWEIYDIAKANDMDVGVARDMFVANLENAGVEGAPHYAGADGLDYTALGREWGAMSAEEQRNQKAMYNEVTRSHYTDLAECRRNGDREKFDAIIANAVEEYEAEHNPTEQAGE